MWIAYWVITGSLAALFLAAGLSKLVRSKAALAGAGMGYVDDFTRAQIKLIGGAEVVGAAGMILPVLLGILPFLGPSAAFALALLMVGAAVTHARRSEAYVVPSVLAVLSAAAGGLGVILLG